MASRRECRLSLLIVERRCHRSVAAVSARRPRQQELTKHDGWTSPRGAAKIQPTWHMDRIRGSSGRAAAARAARYETDDRAYSAWRLSGDGQRSAIEVVGEEEAGAYNSLLAPFGVL
ncbi:hypothetical protein ABVK25_000033 [Lepraria finkii]|uniref:Uncharacterized protein n=1 Tax=Lepraria finkii TaxID=1340010 RepID=A0ABR4BMZ3_9LECA